MLSLFFYKLGAFLARHIPDDLSRSLTLAIAVVQYRLRVRSRRNVRRNLRMILGENRDEREIKERARSVFVNFAESIRLFLLLPRMSRDELVASCHCKELLAKVRGLNERTGFILVTAHIGPWEFGGAYLSAMGLKINTVALDHPSLQVTRFFNWSRASAGLSSYPLDNSFRLLKQALDRKECVVLFIDRIYTRSRRAYNWFGTRVPLPRSHLLLAARCGAPVLPGAFVFSKDGGFKCLIKGPYYLPKGRKREAAIEELQEKCLRDLEDIIRSFPEQWFQFQLLRDQGENGGREKHSG